MLATHQAQLLEASRPGGALRWLGYLSSTGALAPHSAASTRPGSRAFSAGVYGDHGGAWVDEDTPLRVTPAAGKPWLRAQAEMTWRQLHAEHALPVHVFRLGGIYGKRARLSSGCCIVADALRAGPGRSIIEARRGRADGGGSASQRSRGEKRYISRCHVADIVTALLASMDAPAPGCVRPGCWSVLTRSGLTGLLLRSVYNVVDDDPASRAEVSAFADALLRGEPEPPPPQQQQPGSDVVMLGRDEKRVRNTRLKRELGVTLRFPDYRAGLRALHAADKTPFA